MPPLYNIRRWGKFHKTEKSKKELQRWVPSGIGKCHEILLHCCSQDVVSHPVQLKQNFKTSSKFMLSAC
jgi:hypothetical protein